MWEELHEVLGIAAFATVVGTVALGGLLFYHKQVRGFVSVDRKRLVWVHRYGSIAFLALVLLHYSLAPREHVLQEMGALGFLVVSALGWRLHFSKKLFHRIIYSKAVLAGAAAIALLVGHTMVREHRHEADFEDSILFPAPPPPDLAAAVRQGSGPHNPSA